MKFRTADPSQHPSGEPDWTWSLPPLGDVVDFSAARDDSDEEFGIGVLDDDEKQPSSDAPDLNADSSPNDGPDSGPEEDDSAEAADDETPSGPGSGLLGRLIQEAKQSGGVASTSARQISGAAGPKLSAAGREDSAAERFDDYEPQHAAATPQLKMLFAFRSINSIYAVYLAELMHRASYEERLQLLEASLDMPRSVRKSVRVPLPDKMPPGPLATEYADSEVITRGLATQEELSGYRDEETGRRIPPLMLAEKVHLLFRSDFPGIHDARSTAVWCVGELLQFGGDFNKYVRARDLTKQEGIIFRHCLRMILLCGEFAQIEPPEVDPRQWRSDLTELAALLTDSCRTVDPASTDETLTALEGRKLDPNQFVM